MSNEKVRVVGEIEDKARELLGGQNVTPRRMAALLEELEQRRATQAAGVDAVIREILPPRIEGRPQAGAGDFEDPPTVETDEAAAARTAELERQLREMEEPVTTVAPGGRVLEQAPEYRRLEDGRMVPRGGVDPAAPPLTTNVEHPITVPPPDLNPGPTITSQQPNQVLEPTAALVAQLIESNRILMLGMNDLRGEMSRLATARAPETLDEARLIERLPPVGTKAAPPLGLTGPASWPIGTPFVSPLGPKVKVIICQCCGRGQQHHWYCSVCNNGPFHYQTRCNTHHDEQRSPLYIKNHMAPGGVWGISHFACSPLCYFQYLSFMGVVAGVSDHTPPGARGPEATPELARRAGDSD